MTEADREIVELERLVRNLIENDPRFGAFVVVDVARPGERPTLILTRREQDGSGIQMPEPWDD